MTGKILTSYEQTYLRSKLKTAVRAFFEPQNYLEVETPIAVICPGTETYLRYFKTAWTNHQNEEKEFFLRSSPELHMKQLLSTKLPKIFQIAPCFRNHGEFASWHHPEFSLLEWYEAYLSFDQFISQTEDFLKFSANFMLPHLEHCGIKPPLWVKDFSLNKISVFEAFDRFAGLTLIDQDPDLAKKAKKLNIISVREEDDFETAFFKILLDKVEPALAQLGATLLYDYPASQAALAKIEASKAKRCEVYIGSIELSNGFLELTDPEENKSRFLEVDAKRRELQFERPPLDPHFIAALETEFVPCCGQALGLDRWLALLCQLGSIDQIIPFRRHAYLT